MSRPTWHSRAGRPAGTQVAGTQVAGPPDWTIPASDDPGTPGADRVVMSMPARMAYQMVRMYQSLFAGRPSPCRYVPTCSSYALDAYEVHGFVRGSWLAIRRIGRCNPWGGQGWDPVPDRSVRPHPVRSHTVPSRTTNGSHDRKAI